MISLNEWSSSWFEDRERLGFRAVADDRARWRTYVEPSEMARAPLDAITSGIARAWLGSLVKRESRRRARLAPQTLRNTLNLVRVAYRDAIDAELLPEHASNPFDGVRVRTREARTRDAWTVLDVREQRLVLCAMPQPEGFVAAVALGTGMRAGEMWGLELCDVDANGSAPSIIVRHGSHRKATKSGRPRTVPLFGIALHAMKKWLALLPEFCEGKNPHALVFPREDGRARKRGDDVRGWSSATRAAVNRHVRWHDLRHSCATSLLEGWWGARWSVEDVQRLLGHASITTTMRYVHRSNASLFSAARKTRAPLDVLR